jgi:hypothetical protein
MSIELDKIKSLAGTEMQTGYQEPDRSDNQNHRNILTVPQYEFMNDSYTGGGGYKSGYYLVPYPIETMYRERREMAVLKNFVRPIVNAQIDPIYAQDISREIEGEALLAEAFIENVDNMGTDMSEFMRAVGVESALQGMAFIVCDNYDKDEISERESENIDNRVMPYAYIKGVGQVECYELTRNGNIKSITFIDRCDKDAEGKDVQLYRKWSVGLCELQKKNVDPKGAKYVTIEETVLPEGLFPVRAVYFGRRKVDSLECANGMYDIAKLNWSMFNVDSERREVIRKQGFSQFCMQGSPSEGMQVGAGNVIFYSQDAKNPPMYVSPDMGIPKTIREESDEIRQRIFELAEQSGVTGVKLQTSGIAKEWDFQAHGFILKRNAQVLKQAEYWLMETFATYTGTSFEYEAHYKSDYAPRSVVADVANYEAVIAMNISPTANKYAAKRAFMAVFPEAEKEVVEAIEAEVEAVQAIKPEGPEEPEDTEGKPETELVNAES